MKIEICLMSCNDNYKYYSFFPFVKKIWEKILKIKCILIFIGDKLPDELISLSNDIILFKPIEKIHTAFIAQNIRLLYPALLDCANGIIIADIDIIPLSKKYFTEQIEQYSDDKFINYTYEHLCDNLCEYYMCYNIASSKTWAKIFNINSLTDINNILIKWYNDITYIYDDKYRSKCKGFHNDQLMLYKYLNLFNNKELIVLLSRKISRLEVKNFSADNKINLIEDINNDIWYDFHIPKNFNKNNLNFFIDNINK